MSPETPTTTVRDRIVDTVGRAAHMTHAAELAGVHGFDANMNARDRPNPACLARPSAILYCVWMDLR
jgi:hypothetical protein